MPESAKPRTSKRGLIREVGDDIITKYKEYLAECLGVATLSELRYKIKEVSEKDLEHLEFCRNKADLDAWSWAIFHWRWVAGRVWEEIKDYYERRRQELGI
jgi:hypothetical protein